jgi:hypothetical protein
MKSKNFDDPFSPGEFPVKGEGSHIPFPESGLTRFRREKIKEIQFPGFGRDPFEFREGTYKCIQLLLTGKDLNGKKAFEDGSGGFQSPPGMGKNDTPAIGSILKDFL